MAGKIPDLELTPRAGTGKGAARQARRDGLVPGVVYGGGKEPQAITIPFNILFKKLKDKNIKVSMIQIKITPNYGPRYNKMFEQVFEDVAKASNITLLPFFMEAVATDKSLMQADGIHPNAEAQPIIANYVEQQLNNLMTMEQ